MAELTPTEQTNPIPDHNPEPSPTNTQTSGTSGDGFVDLGDTAIVTDRTTSGDGFEVLDDPPIIIDRAPTAVYPSSVIFRVTFKIATLPPPASLTFPVRINVAPAIPVFAPGKVQIPSSLTLVPIPLPYTRAFQQNVKRLIGTKVVQFYDEDRALKTLLNFGDDYQTVITNWQYDPSDPTGGTVLVKLYRPLPDELEEKQQLWIVRELAPPVIDRIFATYRPAPPPKVYLRPANRNVQLTGRSGATVVNATLSSLLGSGSFDAVRPTDPVVEEWFTDDINQSELNIDYADYRNFVFFGSAKARLDAFVQKLRVIENLDALLAYNSSSLSATSTPVTGTLPYIALRNLADQRTDLIRSFDPYERFLYYGTETEYSSSLNTEDDQDALYYNSDATWPKTDGVPVPVASASAWYTIQAEIAEDYDRANQNYLANNLPAYIKDDPDSAEFIQFVNLVGHQFDTLKTYIDAMPMIYDRHSDPAVGLSPDLVWNIAQSFGVELPNQYAIKELVDYTVGASADETVYRQAASETWKRFLHNHIFLLKTRGTRQGLRALANSYGVGPTVLPIKESRVIGPAQISGSFEIIEELSNAVAFTSGASFTVPWEATSSLAIGTVEARIATTYPSASTIYSGDNGWSLNIEPLSGSWGRFVLKSGSTNTAETAYFRLFDGDFYSTMLRYDAAGMELKVMRAEGNDIVESSEVQESSANVSALFGAASTVTVGGNFVGELDEFRVWGETLNDEVFENNVRYPGLYHGNGSTSARDSLYVRLSFNKPVNLGDGSSTLLNESPYARALQSSHILYQFTPSGFDDQSVWPYSMVPNVREVSRMTPNAGANNYSSEKVIIESAPALTYFSGSNVPVLSHEKSVVSVREKKDRGVSSNRVGFYFSMADAVNDNIIRALGNIDLQDLIGDPADQYEPSYSGLKALNDLYWENYAYTFDINLFVDFVRNLLDPMFKQAKALVPGRSKLLTGIVHEPHILERSKVIIAPPPRFDQDLTFEAVAVTSQPTTVESDYLVRSVSLMVTESIQVGGTRPQYDASVSLVDDGTVVVSAADLGVAGQITIMDNDLVVRSECVYFDDTTNFVAFKEALLERFRVSGETDLTGSARTAYEDALVAYRSPSAVSVVNDYITPASVAMGAVSSSAVQEPIKPFSDLDTVAATMYFTDVNGLFSVPTYTRVRVSEGVLRDRGTWASGSAYVRNDYVTHPVTDTEYVCTSLSTSFLSYNDPAVDGINWKPVRYTTIESREIRKAVLVNDKVELVPTTTTGYDVVTGYRPEHYKFTRDRRLGVIRHQYLGCVQTDDTTTDGNPAVQIIPSAGDILIVANPNEPIQPSQNQFGPILDVQ